MERVQKRASKKVKTRDDAPQLKEIKPFSLQEENWEVSLLNYVSSFTWKKEQEQKSSLILWKMTEQVIPTGRQIPNEKWDKHFSCWKWLMNTWASHQRPVQTTGMSLMALNWTNLWLWLPLKFITDPENCTLKSSLKLMLLTRSGPTLPIPPPHARSTQTCHLLFTHKRLSCNILTGRQPTKEGADISQLSS